MPMPSMLISSVAAGMAADIVAEAMSIETVLDIPDMYMAAVVGGLWPSRVGWYTRWRSNSLSGTARKSRKTRSCLVKREVLCNVAYFK